MAVTYKTVKFKFYKMENLIELNRNDMGNVNGGRLMNFGSFAGLILRLQNLGTSWQDIDKQLV